MRKSRPAKERIVSPNPRSASDPPRRWPVFLLGWVLCGLVVLIYFGFKLFSYRPIYGDEHIYYYMAKVMAQGKALPYRDFFFAHPPFQLLLAAAVFKVFGATFTVAKCLPIVSTIATGIAVFVIGWRRLGLFEAIVAMAAFLLCYNVLRVSSHYTGGNLEVALILCGACLILYRRDVLGAILLALSAHTAVYAIPPVALILAVLLVQEPKRAMKVIAIVAGVYAAITVVFLLIAGRGYIEGVFLYHFMKKPRASDKMKYLSENFLFYNFYLTWSIVVAMFCLIWRRIEPSAKPIERPSASGEDLSTSKRRKREKTKRDHRRDTPVTGGMTILWQSLVAFIQTRQGFVVLLLLFLLANFAWLWKLTEWYDYYFLILYPVMALLLGYGLGEMFIGAIVACRDRRWLILVRSLCICALIAIGYTAIKKSQYEQFYANRPPKLQQYVWHDAPGLGPINAWYRAVCWEDRRDPHRDYPGQMYYLWHEMRHLEHLDTAVAYLREHSRPEDRLFGESGMAPLVAFRSDRDLVAYMADTNTKRVISEQISLDEMLATIDVPELRYVIASRQGRSRRYRYINGRLTGWINANFKPVHRFTSPSNPGKVWMILERKTPRATPP